MNRIKPDMYKKSIFDIDYDKLQEKYNIKVLLYDFDNTIIEHKNNELKKETIELFNKLKDKFIIYVVSNSVNSKKLKKLCNILEIPYIGMSFKPLPFGYNKLKFKSIKNSEIATIGDQILTDVYGSKRKGYFSILIDPINEKTEVIFTKINRKIENKIFKKRGKYYD